MRRFALEIFTFLVLTVLTVGVLSRVQPSFRLKKLSSLKGELEVVNLGTSHGWDFEYANAPLNGMNFNISGNTVYYDLQNFRYLSENGYLADNAIIILPVSYFVFGLDENRTDGGVGDAFANQFYEYLPRKYIFNYSLKKDMTLAVHRIQEDLLRFMGRIDLMNPSVRIERKNAAEVPGRQAQAEERSQKTKEQRLLEIAEKRAERHKKLSQYVPEEQNLAYVETLIREIKAANHRVVLVTTPYTSAYNGFFTDQWLEETYYSKMRALAAKYNVPWLDYSHDPRFSSHTELFQDSDHLNPEGKRIFNEIFFNDLARVWE